ncbi:hypothetical protein MGYG_01254 [Nannizzia gypsea CBS 118893]|uniref:Uncharacterized protein n=1 Tax=Arthroderma gypseum (strain ATCC MYA-4604 / CBS 118893) TaxID=535722 RepID=E5QZR8_ARTGP|nr:hypothetical protein MGYG_01254 [Nannizzia gypsea CBS 118893]EFQ98219.1 hypothetical protein MGYG_01254 [Nannizzia gypsea CBS 118893]
MKKHEKQTRTGRLYCAGAEVEMTNKGGRGGTWVTAKVSTSVKAPMRRPLQAVPSRTTYCRLHRKAQKHSTAQDSTGPAQPGLSLVYFESISYEGCAMRKQKQAQASRRME